jgi:hypothetical protein
VNIFHQARRQIALIVKLLGHKENSVVDLANHDEQAAHFKDKQQI